MLDQVVPGYYQRLNAGGRRRDLDVLPERRDRARGRRRSSWSTRSSRGRATTRSTASASTSWATTRRRTCSRSATALDELTLKKDGVDGKAIYLYGEGWNFGEVANNALFEQATQGQLGGTGIGTFTDRLRDAVHGGSPVAGDSTSAAGLRHRPRHRPERRRRSTARPSRRSPTSRTRPTWSSSASRATCATSTLTDADGAVKAGDELDYNGSPAGYADQPDEVITYVDAHDNETLYDLSVLKLPADTSMADRVRMNTLSLATTTLSQTPSFWHAGTELLRSKSLDRNSYNSGDWFNRIDWTGQESTFGSGLPREADNGDKWADHDAAARRTRRSSPAPPTSPRPRHPLSTCCACATRWGCCASARRT